MQDRDFGQLQVALNAKMPPVDQKDVLLKVTSAIEKNDFDSLPQYLSEDVELHIHGMPGMSGSWIGLPNVVAAVKANFSKVTEQKPQVEELIQSGNASAVLLRETGRFRDSGRRYATRGIIWYTFDGSRVKKVEEFLDGQLLDS